jgi:secreted trypsin-like serine protease
MKRLMVLLGALALILGLAASPAQAIIGGSTAFSNPGGVSLWTLGEGVPHRNRCGGALIDDGGAPGSQWVVTNAHCWDGVLAGNQPQARTGSVDNSTGYFAAGIAGHFIAPGYSGDPLYTSDIMLLKLNTVVPANVQKPLKFDMGEPAPGTAGRIFGWGWKCTTIGQADCRVSITGPAKQLNTTIRSLSTCATIYDPGTQLCASASSGGYESACFGDSGEPFYTKGIGEDLQLRALVDADGDDATGADCASAPDGSPGKMTFVKVAPFRTWMLDTIANN